MCANQIQFKNIFIFPKIPFKFIFNQSPNTPSLSSVESLSSVWLFATPWILEFTQTHMHRVSDDIQPSHSLSSPSPPVPNPSQQQGLFKWVSSLHQVAKVLGVSASASVLPVNIQDWFPLGWTGWISKGFSIVISNTTVQKHQFFGTQLSLQSNSYIHTYYWKNHSFD